MEKPDSGHTHTHTHRKEATTVIITMFGWLARLKQTLYRNHHEKRLESRYLLRRMIIEMINEPSTL